MPNVVDTRIVEAQFDSKDFDKNIRQSQKHLEDFKKSLNFDDAARQMREVTNQGGPMGDMFDKMARNVQKLANEFTGIGSISTYVAQKIQTAWHQAANSIEGFVKSLTTAQIHEGSNKYNELLKSVQTIKNATGDTEAEVYRVLGELNKYTDETSYNFTDMAKNIGKFTTAGVSLENAEKEMEGIANWAALAGQGVNEAQRAMYNISQAMSAGYMKLMDYRSIQNANMDIRKFREEALKAAVAVGALTEENGKYYATKAKGTNEGGSTKKKKGKDTGRVEVNMDNFTETLQYGWFNREAMEKVFKVFADQTQGVGKEAYKAAQRCVTFTDALQAIKDMLSTGWMKTYESIFGKLSDAMALFSGLCNKVSEALSKFVETRNKILDRWSLTGRNSLWGALVGEIESPDGETLFKGAYGLLDAMNDIGDSILKAFWDFVRRFVNPEDLEIFDTDEGARFNFLAAGLTHLSHSLQDFTNSINHYLNDVPIGATESRMDQIRHVIESIFAAISLVVHVVSEIGKFGGTILTQLQPSLNAIGALISYLAQLFTGEVVKESKQNSLGSFLQNLATILKPVTTVINFLVTSLARLIATIAQVGAQTGATNKIIAAIPFVKMLANMTLFHKKTSLIGKLLAGLSFATFAKDIFSFGKSTNILKKVSAGNGPLSKLFVRLKTLFSADKMKKLKESFTQRLTGLFTNLPKVLETIKTKFKGFGDGILGLLSWVFETLLNPLIPSAKAESFSGDITDNIVRTIVPGENNPAGAGESILQRIKNGFTTFFKPIKDWFSTFFTKTIPDLMNSEGMQKVKNFFSGTTFTGLLKDVIELKKWTSVGKIGGGLISLGKGIKWLGKGGKVFGKNLKNLKNWDLSGIFSITNTIDSNNKSTSIEFGKFGSQILQIALAVGVLTLAASKLASMKPGELEQAGISLAAMLGGLVLAGVAAKYLTGGGTGLLAIALGVSVLVSVMDRIFKMPAGEFEQVAFKLGALMFGLAAAMWIATGGVFSSGTRKLKGVIGFVVALTMLFIPVQLMLNLMKNNDSDLIKGALGLLTWLTALIAIPALVMGLSNFDGFKGMIRFALSLLLLMAPIQILINMMKADMGKTWIAIGALTLLIIEIGVLAKVSNEKKIAKLGTLVGALAALSIIALIVGKTMDWKQALVGFGSIALLIAAMAWFLKSASKLKEDQIKALKSVFHALAAVILVVALSLIGIQALGVDMTVMIVFFAGIVLTLGVIGYMLKKGRNIKAAALGKMALVLGLVALLIVACAASLAWINTMNLDWKMVLSFFGGITAIVVSVGLMTALLGSIGIGAALQGAAGLAIAIVAVMGALALMAGVLLGSIGNALEDMSARLKLSGGLIADFFKITEGITGDQADHSIMIFKKLKELIESMSGISGHEADINSLTTQLLYLGTGLDFIFLNDSKYPSAESSNGIAALAKLVEMAPQIAQTTFGNISSELMYLGVGLNLFDMSTNGISNANPPALALLTAISDVGKDGLTVPGVMDSLKLKYLGSGLSLFDTSTKSIESSNPPAIGLLTAIASAATSDFSKWDNSLPGKLMYLGSGVSIFDTLTRGITSSETPVVKLIGNLAGQADNLEKFTKLPLNTFSGQLSTLGGAMSLYAKGAKEATGLTPGEVPDVTGAVEILKAICASIAGENGQGALIIPDNMPTEQDLGLFAAQLAALAGALADYANAANSFQGESATKSIELLKLLGEIGGYLTTDNLEATKAFNDAGVSADGSNGTTSLGQFALDVEALGGALSKFASLTSNTTFDGSLGALEKLSTINSLINSDYLAFLTVFSGNGLSGNGNDGVGTPLGIFALDVESLGSALNKFSTLTSNTNFDGSLGALDHFSDLNNKVTKDNLKFLRVFKTSGLTGNGSDGTATPLGKFALDIGALGTALSSFNSLTDSTVFDNGFGALDKFSELNSKLKSDNLAFLKAFEDSGLSGDGSSDATSPLGKFAVDIGALGHALGAFASNVTLENGQAMDFNNSLRALTFLVVLKDRLPDPSGMLSFFTGRGEQFKSLADQLELLGQGLHDFSDKVTGIGDGNSGINVDGVNDALGVIQNLISVMNTMMVALKTGDGYFDIGDAIDTINSFLSQLTEEEMLVRNDYGGSHWLGSRWKTMAEDIATMASDISTAFAKHGDINTDAVATFHSMISGLAELVSTDLSLDFNYPGEMISEGLAVGIRNGESRVVNAIIDVVNAGITAGNDAAGVASPSKVFAEMGAYMDLGLTKGLNDNQDPVKDAAGNVVNTAIDQTMAILGLISQALADNIDFQPKITPVLDLSKVVEGAATLDGMFNSPNLLNLNGALERATAATTTTGPVEVIVQNQPSLDEINGALAQLQSQLETLGTAMSNLQIVLNSGVVAGGVTDDVDANLGRKTLYASRRN